MKTFPINMEDNFHSAVRHSAELRGETMKEFILKAIKTRLSAKDAIILDKDLQAKINNRDKINFIEVTSIKDLFK